MKFICQKGVKEIIFALLEHEKMYKEEIAVKSYLSAAWVDRRLAELLNDGIIDSVLEGRKKYFFLTDKGRKVGKLLVEINKQIEKLEELYNS